jgi:predicted nucleic acid-binding protein
MKRVVCNSSPIIALSSIKQLALLPELFESIYIPLAVYTEVTRGSESVADAVPLKSVLQTPPFQLYQVENREAVYRLFGKLHLGEIEVVMAAKEMSVSEVLLDDLPARKLAQTFLLQPLGTLGVLLLAKREEKIPALKLYLDQLMDKNFRVSAKLYEQVLMYAGEK